MSDSPAARASSAYGRHRKARRGLPGLRGAFELFGQVDRHRLQQVDFAWTNLARLAVQDA